MHIDPFTELYQQENEKHLRDYLRILLNRKGIILAITVITFLIVTLSTFSKTPIYTATTNVLIEKNVTGADLQGQRMYMIWDPNFMATQFELIRSFNVAYRVVETLQLDTKYTKNFIDDSKPGFSLIGFAKNTVSTVLSYLFSDSKETSVSDKKNITDIQTQAKKDKDRIAATVQANISVAPVRDTKIVLISYSHKDPAMAQMVANAVVQAYIDETLEIKSSLTKYSLKWMTTKAGEERKKLEASEKALQQYMRDNDIVTVENKLAIYPQKLGEFSSRLSASQAEVKEYEAIYKQIEKAGKDYKAIESLPLFADNNVLQNLRERIYTSEQNIKELSKKYGHKHPAIIQANTERDLLLKEKESEINRIIKSTKNAYELAQSSINDLSQLIAATKVEMQDMNERFIQYTIMEREMNMNQAVYNALATSIKKENITEQSQDIKIWVTKKAGLPGYPSKPNKKKQLMTGLMAGLFGGVMLAFFLEYLDNTVKSAREIEERYNLTVLGSVEDLKGKNNPIETHVKDNPLSPLAESYRLIQSALLLSSPDHPPRTILITSMVQQEGKTTTTGNLALILAQNNKKVLIIDCDMRRPRQHSLFGISNNYGLSNYLSGNIDEQQTLIQKTEDSAISIIVSGPVPPNPAELLSSKRMSLILEEAQKEYDFILLDSPPVQQVTDSLMLGQLVDGTIIVTRTGKTTYDLLANGLKKLRERHTHILGVILNRVDRKNTATGYYGYYSYYSRGDQYTKANDS